MFFGLRTSGDATKRLSDDASQHQNSLKSKDSLIDERVLTPKLDKQKSDILQISPNHSAKNVDI